MGRWDTVSNFGLVILYGVNGGRSKEADLGSRAPECSPIWVTWGAGKPVTAGVCRVNPGPGVDASDVTGRNSKGDPRTYPGGPPGPS
ncbi:hypothetical protein GCM10011428_56670 [Streptomyces violaceus]